jgi:hypothetical protein
VRATDVVDMMPDGPLWPRLVTPRISAGPASLPPGTVASIAIIAIESHPVGGEARWEFDYAATIPEAYEKLRHWNARAAREWPGLRFTLKERQ